MANNYTQFSEVLDLSSDLSVRNQQVDWINLVLNVRDNSENLDIAKSILEANGIDIDAEDIEYWCDFLWKVELDRIWIYSEESGNLNNVGIFVSAFMKKFNIQGVWTLQWSESCSKPRIGEFGGGAMLVDSETIISKSTSQIVSELCESHKKVA